MSTLGTVLAIMLWGFVTGALARLAVPGPDPMPVWLTVAIGLVGSAVGGAIGAVASGRNPFAVSVASFGAAVLLVVAYRKLFQNRPVVGAEALRYPRRGIGVDDYRARLTRAGVDPDALLDRALDQQRRRERSDEEPPEGDPPEPSDDEP